MKNTTFNQGMLLLCFLLSLVQVQAQEKVVDKIIAKVGEHVVLLSDIEAQKFQLKQQGVKDVTDCMLMEDLLYQKLLLHHAELDSVEVTASQVEGELENRIRFFVNQIGSEAELEKFYGKSIVEIKEEFREKVRERLLTEAMEREITTDVKITPSEVREFYESIPKDSLPLINAEVEVAQLVRKPVITKAEHEAAREYLQGYRDKVANGSLRMQTVATSISRDPGSRDNGGELGFAPRGSFATEFEAVAYSLNKGEVSQVFETEFGYHFMQLIERRGESVNVRHVLHYADPTVESLVRQKEYLDSIMVLVEADSMSFEEAIYSYSDDEDTRNNKGLIVNQYTASTKIDMAQLNQVDPELFYLIKDLKVGEKSEVVLTKGKRGKDLYRIVELKSRTEPHKANMTQDYQLLQNMAQQKKKAELVEDWVEERILLTYIELDESFDACELNYNWIKKIK